MILFVCWFSLLVYFICVLLFVKHFGQPWLCLDVLYKYTLLYYYMTDDFFKDKIILIIHYKNIL